MDDGDAETRQNGFAKRSLMATCEEAKRRKSRASQASAVGVCQIGAARALNMHGSI